MGYTAVVFTYAGWNPRHGEPELGEALRAAISACSHDRRASLASHWIPQRFLAAREHARDADLA